MGKGTIIMIKDINDIKKAVNDAAAARVTVWNARLELAVQGGDRAKIDEILSLSPVADGSGCNCGCGGFSTPGERVSLPEMK